MISTKEFLYVLHKELERTTGCTDPAAIALAAARASVEINAPIDSILVELSPNVYKNSAAVGVPGSSAPGSPIQRGGAIAAALGSQLFHWKKGLAVLDDVDEALLKAAQQLIVDHKVTVRSINAPDPLTIVVTIKASEQTAKVIIAGDYAHITEVRKNGEVIFSAPKAPASEGEEIFMRYPLRDLISKALSVDTADLAFLLDAMEVNVSAAKVGLNAGQLRLGPALSQHQEGRVEKTRAWVGAAGEARMAGLRVPVVAITGSGNHGITLFTGMAALAEDLDSSKEEQIRALAIGSVVTTYIKGHIMRMTAFCGCSVAAATGLGAGAIHLLGGGYTEMEQTMQSVIGTLAGMICDGAKESCAYKISTAAQTALQFADLAMEGVHLQYGVGILGDSIEETFANLGRLNNPAMLGADKLILDLLQEREKN